MKNKTQRKSQNKMQRTKYKSKCKPRRITRVRMRGGKYDVNTCFEFPASSYEFNNSKSMITFSTENGYSYTIAKNPMVLLSVLQTIQKTYDKIGNGIVIDRMRYKPIIDNAKPVMDFSDESSGMFFLYGKNSQNATNLKYGQQYGLFYLLNRIQLLAVLYKIKTMPNTKFPTLGVSLPINQDSRLPSDYNDYPHGYFFEFTRDTTDDDFATFVAFVKLMNNMNELTLPLTEDAIATLELPPFLKLTRMKNPMILTFAELPNVTDTNDIVPSQTDMESLDGGRRRLRR